MGYNMARSELLGLGSSSKRRRLSNHKPNMPDMQKVDAGILTDSRNDNILPDIEIHKAPLTMLAHSNETTGFPRYNGSNDVQEKLTLDQVPREKSLHTVFGLKIYNDAKFRRLIPIDLSGAFDECIVVEGYLNLCADDKVVEEPLKTLAELEKDLEIREEEQEEKEEKDDDDESKEKETEALKDSSKKSDTVIHQPEAPKHVNQPPVHLIESVSPEPEPRRPTNTYKKASTRKSRKRKHSHSEDDDEDDDDDELYNSDDSGISQDSFHGGVSKRSTILNEYNLTGRMRPRSVSLANKSIDSGNEAELDESSSSSEDEDDDESSDEDEYENFVSRHRKITAKQLKEIIARGKYEIQLDMKKRARRLRLASDNSGSREQSPFLSSSSSSSSSSSFHGNFADSDHNESSRISVLNGGYNFSAQRHNLNESGDESSADTDSGENEDSRLNDFFRLNSRLKALIVDFQEEGEPVAEETDIGDDDESDADYSDTSSRRTRFETIVVGSKNGSGGGLGNSKAPNDHAINREWTAIAKQFNKEFKEKIAEAQKELRSKTPKRVVVFKSVEDKDKEEPPKKNSKKLKISKTVEEIIGTDPIELPKPVKEVKQVKATKSSEPVKNRKLSRYLKELDSTLLTAHEKVNSRLRSTTPTPNSIITRTVTRTTPISKNTSTAIASTKVVNKKKKGKKARLTRKKNKSVQRRKKKSTIIPDTVEVIVIPDDPPTPPRVRQSPVRKAVMKNLERFKRVPRPKVIRLSRRDHLSGQSSISEVDEPSNQPESAGSDASGARGSPVAPATTTRKRKPKAAAAVGNRLVISTRRRTPSRAAAAAASATASTTNSSPDLSTVDGITEAAVMRAVEALAGNV